MEDGDFFYSATIDAVLMDLDGDGVIRANAGFYGGYTGPSEVLELTISFSQDGVPIASYQNVAAGGGIIDYPFFFFEWEIGRAELSSWDMGADPGVFCFGGPSVTTVPGSFFIDQDAGVLGSADAIGRRLILEAIDQGPFVGDSEPVIPFLNDIRASESRIAAMRIGSSVQCIEIRSPLDLVAGGELNLQGASAIRFVTDDNLACVQRIRNGNFASIVSMDDPASLVLFADIQMNSEDEDAVDVGYIGGHVYVWEDGETRVYELVGPGNAPLVATLPFSIDGGVGFGASDLVPVGNVALVTAGTELRVYDFSDPVAPVQIAAVPYPTGLITSGWDSGQNRTLEIDNGLAIVRVADPDAGSEQVLLLYDVRDPVVPVYLGEVRPGGFPGYFGYARERLVVGYTTGIPSATAYHIDDPTMPFIDSEFPSELVAPFDAIDDVLYARQRDTDAISPADLNTRTRRAVTPTASTEFFDVDNGLVFAADNQSGLVVIDSSISTPNRVIAELPIPGGGTLDVTVCDQALLVCADTLVVAVDASDPFAPTVLDTISLGTEPPFRIDSIGSIAYALTCDEKVHVIDASSPNTLTSLGSTAVGTLDGSESKIVAGPTGFFLAEERLLPGAETIYELVCYDATDPANIVAAGSVAIAGSASDLAYADGRLYVIGYETDDGGGSLEIFDVSVPANPTLLSRTELGGNGYGIAIEGAVLFVATEDDGLLMFDVSEDCGPLPLRSAVIPEPEGVLAVSGDTVYLANDGDVVALDVASRCIGIDTDTDGNGTPDPCEPVQNLSAGTGYGAIQDAIDQAAQGDVIEIAAGVHPANAIVLPFGRDLTIQGTGPGLTILDGSINSVDAPILDLRNTGQTTSTIFRDMTIRNGSHSNAEGGSGASLQNTSATFERVEFLDNAGPGDGSGVAHVVAGGAGHVVFDRCEFRGGSGAYDALNAYGSATVELRQCLVADNQTFEAVRLDSTGNTVVNSTIVGDDTTLGRAFLSVGGSVDITNTVIVGFTVNGGGATFNLSRCLAPPGVPGDNIGGFPTFIDRSNGDYRLDAASLGIDAADGDVLELGMYDLAGQSRFCDDSGTPDSGIGSIPFLDVGAYEFQGTTPERCAADINGDNTLNFDDIDGFVSAFMAGNFAANLDGNDLLNLDDIDLFVDSFLTGCP